MMLKGKRPESRKFANQVQGHNTFGHDDGEILYCTCDPCQLLQIIVVTELLQIQ